MVKARWAFIVLISMFGSILSPLQAQTTTGTWTKQTQVYLPPGRDSHAMAYDAENGQVVLFGGSTGSPTNDTWVWDESRWIQKYPQLSPISRIGHAMVYDRLRRQVLLFGGMVWGVYTSTITPLDDTWAW
ncbi:MAG TPA: kelch repeat-containing protein, partial [Terriglobia bacterium]|nr:kelch repeat-containing protein [Terriglobia bacterium]